MSSSRIPFSTIHQFYWLTVLIFTTHDPSYSLSLTILGYISIITTIHKHNCLVLLSLQSSFLLNLFTWDHIPLVNIDGGKLTGFTFSWWPLTSSELCLPAQLDKPTAFLQSTDRASLVAQSLKNLPAVQETRGFWSLGREDALEKEMATHSSILAWKIPRTEDGGACSPWGHKESGTTEWLTLNQLPFLCSQTYLSLPSFFFLSPTPPHSLTLRLTLFPISLREQKQFTICKSGSSSSPYQINLHLIWWWRHSVRFISFQLQREAGPHDESPLIQSVFLKLTCKASAKYPEIGTSMYIKTFLMNSFPLVNHDSILRKSAINDYIME